MRQRWNLKFFVRHILASLQIKPRCQIQVHVHACHHSMSRCENSVVFIRVLMSRIDDSS